MKKVCPRFKQFEGKLKEMDDRTAAAPAVEKKVSTLTDYLSGQEIQDIGAEANRQAVLKFLVETRGFAKEAIETDAPLSFEVKGTRYQSRVDVVVSAAGRRRLVIKCAPGSLGSREREAVSAARLLERRPIPLAAVSDGQTAVLLDTATGKKLAEGLDALPSAEELAARFQGVDPEPMPPERLERERLVFRTYDSMNVNVCP